MNTDASEPWVQDLVELIKQRHGEDAAKDFLIYWGANEKEIAFGGFVEMIVYDKIALPPDLQKQVVAFAEDFDAQTGGRTHFAKDLRQLN